jgi:hypothetical protein
LKANKNPSLVPYELQKMAGSAGVCALFLLYLLILASAVWFPAFRDAYLHLQETDFLPFWAFGGILPAFVTLTLVLGISPLFAGDVQSRTREEFGTCARGRDALCRARSAAAFLFAALVNLSYQGGTFLFGLLWARFPDWNKGIQTVYPGSDFQMTVGAYCALAALLIFSGSLVLAALTAYASARSKTAVAPCSASVLFWAVEYVFLKLGAANLGMNYLSNINACKAMDPVVNLYPSALAPFDFPARAMGIMLLCFAAAVGLLLWRCSHWRRDLADR